MAKDNKSVELEGTIHTVLPGTMFRVELENGHLVLAHISGKMRKRFIRLVAGDRVKLEMSPYDVDKARFFFEKMLGYANHLGLYGEELGPRGEHLGNYPQAFTHLGLISAAYYLDRQLSDMRGGRGR